MATQSQAQAQAQTQAGFVPYPTLQDTDDRQKEIENIHTDLISVKEICTEIATMVEQQSTDVDNIEMTTEDTQHHVAEAVKELTAARKYQRANPLTKILTVCTATVIGAGIGGPVGLLAGLKLWSIGTAAAGAIVGGYAGKKFHEKS